MLYTIEFSFEQLGQVYLIIYPDLVPITIGLSVVFIVICHLHVVYSSGNTTCPSLSSLTLNPLNTQGIPRRMEQSSPSKYACIMVQIILATVVLDVYG